MKFRAYGMTTNSNPQSAVPMIIDLDRFHNKDGGSFWFEIDAFADADENGVADGLEIPDIERKFEIPVGHEYYVVLQNRFRGSGNLYAGIRTFTKNFIKDKFPAATFVDLDNDDPIPIV